MLAAGIEINIAKEFARIPGPRKRTEGQYSGEQFLEEILRPRFLAAREARTLLRIDLDGAVGYPTSFLEEAFGGLAREFGKDEVQGMLEFKCNDEPYLEQQIRKYIRQANVKGAQG